MQGFMGSVKREQRKKTRVLIVDDHPLVRERLRELIEREPDLAVCGEAADHQPALLLANTTQPDLVLVDLTLRESHGLDLLKDLHIRHPEIPVLVLSMHDESLYAERAIRAGARGYITKQEATKSVLKAIRTVLAGNIYLSEAQLADVTAKMAGRPRGQVGLGIDSLTDRELRVFELLGQGLSTRAVSLQLRLDMRTVETYRARIKQKLNLDGATELLQHAIRWVESGGLPRRR
ncbi:MAG TPA: response regulator transcription factor [Verrucomicrobiae bacterium]